MDGDSFRYEAGEEQRTSVAEGVRPRWDLVRQRPPVLLRCGRQDALRTHERRPGAEHARDGAPGPRQRHPRSGEAYVTVMGFHLPSHTDGGINVLRRERWGRLNNTSYGSRQGHPRVPLDQGRRYETRCSETRTAASTSRGSTNASCSQYDVREIRASGGRSRRRTAVDNVVFETTSTAYRRARGPYAAATPTGSSTTRRAAPHRHADDYSSDDTASPLVPRIS